MSKRNQEITAEVETHRARLESFIERRVRDQAEAQDVFQNVIEEYIESYDINTVIESLGSWLVKVAQNKIRDLFRRKKTRAEYDQDLRQTSDASSATDSPEGELTRRWIRQELVEAIENLPEEQRFVFIRHELEGKSFEDISAETGVGVNTLLARKRYAIRFLREYLKEIYDELE